MKQQKDSKNNGHANQESAQSQKRGRGRPKLAKVAVVHDDDPEDIIDEDEEEEEKPLARRRKSVKVIEDLSRPKSPVKNGNNATEINATEEGMKTAAEEDKKAAVEEHEKTAVQALAESLVEDEPLEVDDNASEVSADEESLPSTFDLGDLAWARIGSAPYWPCIITHDPNDKYTCVKMNNRRKELRREYHVQFFGRVVQRAWVEQPNLLKFEGLEAFDKLAKNVTNKATKAAFTPKSNVKATWSEAIQDCISCVVKTAAERLEFSKIRASTPVSRKRPRRPSTESLDANPAKKAKLFSESEKLIAAIPEAVIEENRRKLKTGFKLFQLAHREEVLKDIGPHGLEKALSKMWSSKSAAEQRFFQEKAAAFLNTTPDLSDELSSEASSIAEQPLKPAKKAAKAVSKSEGMVGIFKKESCCMICEEVSNEEPISKCKGCTNAYHMSCLGEAKNPETTANGGWKCPECISGKYNCGLCFQVKLNNPTSATYIFSRVNQFLCN